MVILMGNSMTCSEQDSKIFYSLFQKVSGVPLSSESHGSISKNNLTTALEDEARVKNEARNLSLEARSLSRRELATEQKETCSLLFTTFHPNSQNNKISANSQLTDELESTCSIQSTHIKESSDKFLADKHTKVSPDLLPDPTVETIGVTKVGNASVIESNNIGTQREPASKKIPRKKSGSSGAGILSFLSGYSPNILSPKEPRARDNCSTPSIKSGVTSRELLSAETSEINLRPRKKLKVNPKTGTLSSSPKLEANSSINMVEDLSRKSKTGCKSMIIQIKYNDAIGQKLDQLMNSNVSISPSQNPTLANKNSISHHGHIQNRAIHPLFLEKKLGYDVHSTKKETKKDLPPSEIPSSSILELTKRNLTRTRINSQNTLLYRSKKSENYTSTSRTAIMSEMKKFPGAIEPAWPWKGIVHIRGLSEEETLLSMGLNFKSIVSARAKKSKENAVDISSAENIIISISNNMPVSLVASAIKNLDSDRFPYIQSSIRLPIKHLESGLHAQRRLKKQLSMRAQQPSLKNSTSSEDEIPSPCSQPKTPVHPAITKAFASVANSISAFEKGECETQAWAQKYSPQKVEEVLQIGHEPYILKDWLSHMTVRSIEVSSTVTKQSANSKTEPCNKKRKSTKLDGFIIPTDEEEGDDLDEIEKHLAHDTCKSPGQTNRTIVRGGKLSIKRKKSSRTHSSILISGPHGCGKSAAIYAAAKELNFEVFEINSSSKRGGKDIMDRIGDMTMNHHVHNAATTSHLGSTDKDRNISEDLSMTEGEKSYQGNIKSTLQSNSSKPVIENFKEPGYTSQNSSRSRSKGRKKAKKARASKNQKQSLILIEEADIIFKEDINFWSTVENIIAVSKRPIIITCNDESVIPLSHKFFHAILRFRPPPVELAVDYILMIAAIEGHAIQREAVKALYEERRLDLRASIWELNFWCQFAVGDINRGLSWYHQRQNAPLYVGERMDRIRVISENTYQKGMGWLSQDILEGNLSHLEIEEVILNQTCEYWNFDIGDWEKSIGLGKWTEIFQKLYNDKDKHLIALNLFADYTETMSDSDLISDSLFGSENQLTLDPCAPKTPSKIYEEYPLGYKIIDTEPIVRYSRTAQSISLFLRSRARTLLQVPQHLDSELEIQSELSSLTESRVIDLICKKCTDPPENLQRITFDRAFDPISYPFLHHTSYSSSHIESSQFGRTQQIISEDLAPYVRGIVAYSSRIQRERERESNLVCDGGSGGKRRRRTRAAMSALEGTRSETRRERYFGNVLNSYLVEKTGVPDWDDALTRLQDQQRLEVEEQKNCTDCSI